MITFIEELTLFCKAKYSILWAQTSEEVQANETPLHHSRKPPQKPLGMVMHRRSQGTQNRL